MKIVIPGGSGHIGAILSRAFVAAGHQVVVLTRNPAAMPGRAVEWDGKRLGPWASEADGADVVINLAGRSVNCRYTARNRREILQSRIDSTRVVGEAIARASRPPLVWLQAATATIYAHRYDAANDERTGIIGGAEPQAPETWSFSIDVAKAWEETAEAVHVPRTRKVLLRSAMTMSPDAGGVFDVLLRLVRFGLGGQNGNGRQYVSWIHEEDFVRAIFWLIEHNEFAGPVNICSPNPLPNAKFMRTLREAYGRRLGLPASRWMLELGAFLLRTETELILKSRRVVPTRLMDSGFEFRFPSWSDATTDLCRQWRVARRPHINPGGSPLARPLPPSRITMRGCTDSLTRDTAQAPGN